MKALNFITATTMAIVLFTACQKDEVDLFPVSMNKSATISGNVNTQVYITTVDDLTQADIDGLMLMREEEKLARDVYDYFFTTYGVSVFDRISNSEQQHTSTVLAYIEYLGLTDPATDEAGVFDNSGLQALYAQLTAAGSSVELALSTGAFIEEYDIADLNKLLAETQNADIIRIYANLEKDSEKHLRAFASNLLQYGITYEPQILDKTVYAEILASASGNGSNAGNRNGGNSANASGVCDGTGINANGDGVSDGTGIAAGGNNNSATGQYGNGNGKSGKK